MNSSKTSSPIAELRALANFINSSLDSIETVLKSRSQTFPSLNEAFDPSTEVARMSPGVAEHVSVIVAAASQLAAAVKVPALGLSYGTIAYYTSASLRVAIQCHVAEILRDAGPEGLPVDKLAAPSGADPHKLARCLRLLATNHIFREVAPDIFAHNKISSLLDTGKSISTILADVHAKHDGTSGLAAIIEESTDVGMKSAAWLAEALLDPETAKSGEANKTAFTKAYDTDLPMWSFYEQPQYAYTLRRFGMAMQGMQNMSQPGAILEGFDWKLLPQSAIVVDVGGGVGSHTLALCNAFGHLNFVVQDRESVIQEARKYWAEKSPTAIESGRVKLAVHDFFTAQPVKEPAVFLLRQILHDWSDKYAKIILKKLREVAGPNTQLLIVDNTISYACHDTTGVQEIPGALANEHPAPLLANKGVTSAQLYGADVHMMALFNASERTVAEFDTLFRQTGWKLERVFRGAGFDIENAKLIAVPGDISIE